MAAANKLDSLEYSNRLRKAGFTEEQANVQANALFSVIEEQLLTKQDLKEVETKLTYDMKELELRLKNEIKESELRLLFRLTGIITVIMSVIGAMIKFLPSVH